MAGKPHPQHDARAYETRSKRRQRRGAVLTIADDGPLGRQPPRVVGLLSGAGLPRSSVGT
jgi:hypothetical protein